MKRFLLFYLVLATLPGCDAVATFRDPQPAGGNNLNAFPERLLGEYRNADNHSRLSVGQHLIRRTYRFDYRFHKDEPDSLLVIENNFLVNRTTGEKAPLRFEGDSGVASVNWVDTLFFLDSDHLLRKSGGNYFLNSRHENNGWEVQKVQLRRNQLTISHLVSEADVRKLQQLTGTGPDTVRPQQFTVTRKQFLKFVRKKGFDESELFLKERVSNVAPGLISYP